MSGRMTRGLWAVFIACVGLGAPNLYGQSADNVAEEDLKLGACYASQMEPVAQLLSRDTVPVLMVDRSPKGPLTNWLQGCEDNAPRPTWIDRVRLLMPAAMKAQGYPSGLVRITVKGDNEDPIKEEEEGE